MQIANCSPQVIVHGISHYIIVWIESDVEIKRLFFGRTFCKPNCKHSSGITERSCWYHHHMTYIIIKPMSKLYIWNFFSFYFHIWFLIYLEQFFLEYHCWTVYYYRRVEWLEAKSGRRIYDRPVQLIEYHELSARHELHQANSGIRTCSTVYRWWQYESTYHPLRCRFWNSHLNNGI